MDERAPEISDESLAVRVQEGDTTAFDDLMRRYEEKLIRYGKRFLTRKEDVEDAVQDAFLRAYMNIRSFNPAQRFSPWMYRIAHNVFVNILRKYSRQSFQLIDFDTFISPLGVEEEALTDTELAKLREALDSALATIEPKYREVLVLHYFEELSYDEIADVLQIPKGTVGIRLRRGREALKKKDRALTDHYYGT